MTRPYSPEVKAMAVAAVAAGEMPADVARRVGCSQGRLKEWCDQHGPKVSGSTYARTRDELGGLVYDAVAETLKSLAVRARVTGQPDWISRQPAAELAALAGTDWDRVIRILSGFKPRDPDPDLDTPTPSGAA